MHMHAHYTTCTVQKSRQVVAAFPGFWIVRENREGRSDGLREPAYLEAAPTVMASKHPCRGYKPRVSEAGGGAGGEENLSAIQGGKWSR